MDNAPTACTGNMLQSDCLTDLQCADMLLDSRAMVSPKTQAQAPLRSLDQRMEALKRANDIRVKRAS